MFIFMFKFAYADKTYALWVFKIIMTLTLWPILEKKDIKIVASLA